MFLGAGAGMVAVEMASSCCDPETRRSSEGQPMKHHCWAIAHKGRRSERVTPSAWRLRRSESVDLPRPYRPRAFCTAALIWSISAPETSARNFPFPS